MNTDRRLYPKTNDTPVCAACHKPRAPLYPFRPEHFPQDWAPTRCCNRCFKARWAERKRLAAAVDATAWAERQTEKTLAEAYFRRRDADQYRGMIRTTPWPPQGRVPSFVWELKPQFTLFTEYDRGFRFAKTDW